MGTLISDSFLVQSLRKKHPELDMHLVALEARILRREKLIVDLEQVIRILRARVGDGFRSEVMEFSDSIKGLLSSAK